MFGDVKEVINLLGLLFNIYVASCVYSYSYI